MVTAIIMPAILGIVALGVECSSWMLASVQLQGLADVSALSAATVFYKTADAHLAVNAGADLAEINGVKGAGGRVWNAATKSLSDGTVSVALVSGVRHSSDNAMKVTIVRQIPLVIAKLFTALGSVSISATATAEIVLNNPSTPQPCVLALGNGVVSSVALSVSGSSSITANGCSLRSDGSVSVAGSASITSPDTYAAGTITISSSGQINGAQFAGAGSIVDPYASNTSVQNAFSQLSPGSGTAITLGNNKSLTINPGVYSSISVSGNAVLTMMPGLYIINGDVSVGGTGDVIDGTIQGYSGVTIISSGSLSLSGNTKFAMTAPDTQPYGNAIPGILFASNGTTANGKSISISGNGTLAGVVYAPHEVISISGSATADSSNCLEYIGQTVSLSGHGSMGGACSSMGAASFSGLPSGFSVVLVQ